MTCLDEVTQRRKAARVQHWNAGIQRSLNLQQRAAMDAERLWSLAEARAADGNAGSALGALGDAAADGTAGESATDPPGGRRELHDAVPSSLGPKIMTRFIAVIVRPAPRPASVILTLATSMVFRPMTMRSAVAVASPARTMLAICSTVKQSAARIASEQPSGQEGSGSRAAARAARHFCDAS